MSQYLWEGILLGDKKYREIYYSLCTFHYL